MPVIAVASSLVRIATAAALAGGAVVTRAATITCPAAMVETPVVSSQLTGWDVDVRAGRRTLAGAAIQVSRGSERQGVAPDAVHQSGRQETTAWTLTPMEGAVYWVACSYGNTSALLMQRVPDNARECVASTDVVAPGRRLNVRPVECR